MCKCLLITECFDTLCLESPKDLCRFNFFRKLFKTDMFYTIILLLNRKNYLEVYKKTCY